jgi:hypothetical protein
MGQPFCDEGSPKIRDSLRVTADLLSEVIELQDG